MQRRDFLKNCLAPLTAYTALIRDARAAGTSRVPKLKIVDIKGARFRNMGNSFVRVYTDQGITGTGEMINEIGSPEMINQFLAPQLKGRNPLDIERIYYDLWNRVFDRGLGGPYLTAMSGIDVALWDLAGKALGLPICRLFGGPVRTKIAVYHHHNYQETPQDVVAMLKRTRVKAFKTSLDRVTGTTSKIEGLDPDVRGDWSVTNRQIDALVAHVASLREAAGPDIEIALECHTKYNTESAIRIAKALEPLRPMWLEEPIPPDNPDAMALIRRSTTVPIAGGENLYTRHGFRPVLEKQALSIIQPDMLKCGGLLETRKIAAMAEVYHVPMAPHGVATPLGKLAMSHICATVPNFKIQEWSLNESGQKFTEPADLRDGFVYLPDKPGIGVELVQDLVKERLLPGYQFPI